MNTGDIGNICKDSRQGKHKQACHSENQEVIAHVETLVTLVTRVNIANVETLVTLVTKVAIANVETLVTFVTKVATAKVETLVTLVTKVVIRDVETVVTLVTQTALITFLTPKSHKVFTQSVSYSSPFAEAVEFCRQRSVQKFPK